MYNRYLREKPIGSKLACGHSPTGAPAPAKPRPFFTPRPRPNVSNEFAGVYLFLLEKEPRKNSGKARP